VAIRLAVNQVELGLRRAATGTIPCEVTRGNARGATRATTTATATATATRATRLVIPARLPPGSCSVVGFGARQRGELVRVLRAAGRGWYRGWRRCALRRTGCRGAFFARRRTALAIAATFAAAPVAIATLAAPRLLLVAVATVTALAAFTALAAAAAFTAAAAAAAAAAA